MSIKLEYSTVANCKPEHIWKHFQDVSTWPAAVPRVIGSAAWTEGEPWQPGSKFEMKLLQPMPMYVKPEVKDCAAPTSVHWLAPGSAVTSEQWFAFEPQPDGTTKMTARQEFTGPMVFMFGETVKKQIVDMYSEWMKAVKAQAEQSAGNGATPAAAPPQA